MTRTMTAVCMMLAAAALPAFAQAPRDEPTGGSRATADYPPVMSGKNLELPAEPLSREDVRKGSVFFVGTATTIIRFGGFAILTDPNFLHKGDHVHLGYGIQSERLTNPAIELDELGPIDFVLLSHYHDDHFDEFVEQNLDKQLPIVSTPDAVAKLRDKGFESGIALKKWESLTVSKGDAKLRITAMPARHGPPVVNLALPETMGSMLEFQGTRGTSIYNLYISGDTLVFDDIRAIPQRYPDIDLALLHLGGTRVAGVLLTMDDKQGVEMIRIVEPHTAIPIHYNDYTVFESPLDDFVAAVKEAGLEAKVRYLKHGESYMFEARGEQK